MSDQTHSRFTNYETWVINLWLDNEEHSQDYWSEMAKIIYKDTDKGEHRVSNAANSLAECIKEAHEDNMPELEGPFSDLLSGALSAVNWYEIALTYIEDIKDEVEAEEKEEEGEDTEPCRKCGKETSFEELELANGLCNVCHNKYC